MLGSTRRRDGRRIGIGPEKGRTCGFDRSPSAFFPASPSPVPDDWNAWRSAKKDELAPQRHFVCVQSVVADGRGSLWVLDPAAPARGFVVAGGQKLVRIDLKTNEVVRTVSFGEAAAPQGSHLNGVRFSPPGRPAFDPIPGASRRGSKADATHAPPSGYGKTAFPINVAGYETSAFPLNPTGNEASGAPLS